MSQFAVNNVWSDRNTHDVTSNLAPLMAYAAAPFINILQLQTQITTNWDNALRNIFHYHNLVFMQNPIK